MTFSQERISIIIPTLNAGLTIDATCQSIVSQKECDWEAIFVDGGSQDRTCSVIQSYNDSRFRIQALLTSKPYQLVNRGIHLAQGGLIAILFAGDTLLYPKALHDALQAKDPNSDFFYGASWINQELYYKPFQLELLDKGIMPCDLASCLFSRKIFEKVGLFSTRDASGADVDFMRRLLKAKASFSTQERVFVESQRR